jgi:hypothetical protein
MQRQRLILILVTIGLIIIAVLVAPHTLAINNSSFSDYLRSSIPGFQVEQASDDASLGSYLNPNQIYIGALAMRPVQP